MKILQISLALFATLFFATGAFAADNAMNPNISFLGNFIASHDNSPLNPNQNKTVFGLSELEITADSYLNPYSKASVIVSMHYDNQNNLAAEIEEANISIFKGLPISGLNLKLGKFFVDFGRINTVHSHALPFITAPRSLSQFIPAGDGNYSDSGVEASYLFPSFFGGASTLSGNVLTGEPFHDANDTSLGHYAYAARLNNSYMLSDSMPLEVGFSWMQGVSNVADDNVNNILEADFKVKKTFSNAANLVVQGEYFYNLGNYVDTINLTPLGVADVRGDGRYGFYAFANMTFLTRWNAGAIYEQYQRQGDNSMTDYSYKAFAGFSLLEETTVFRVSAEHFVPQNEQASNIVMFQLVFAMGPHKAHIF